MQGLYGCSWVTQFLIGALTFLRMHEVQASPLYVFYYLLYLYRVEQTLKNPLLGTTILVHRW